MAPIAAINRPGRLTRLRARPRHVPACAGRPPRPSCHPMHTITKVKLIIGGILLVLGIVFAVQNAAVVEVKFLVWSLKMSQALVIFLTGAAGAIIGFFFGTAFKITRQN
jgi:uncharacterized integral membrane protein